MYDVDGKPVQVGDRVEVRFLDGAQIGKVAEIVSNNCCLIRLKDGTKFLESKNFISKVEEHHEP